MIEAVLGLLVGAFIVYFFAHAWVIRPLIERATGGRFPFIDRILGRSGRMGDREYRKWYREYYGEDPD